MEASLSCGWLRTSGASGFASAPVVVCSCVRHSGRSCAPRQRTQFTPACPRGNPWDQRSSSGQRSARKHSEVEARLSHQHNALRQPAAGRFPVFVVLELLNGRCFTWREGFMSSLKRVRLYTRGVHSAKTRKRIWPIHNTRPGADSSPQTEGFGKSRALSERLRS